MKKIDRIVDLSKKIIPAVTKVAPKISKLITSIDILERTSAMAKPFVDDARNKGIEKSKVINAVQVKTNNKFIIFIEKAGVVSMEESEELAFERFIRKLDDLRNKKILSHNKKVRKSQINIIHKMNKIIDDGGNIENYVYRIHYQ